MFKRLFIVALCIGLTALLGAGGDPVYANEGDLSWLTDGTIQSNSWQGLPDKQERTAKFLVLDGRNNNGLGGFGLLGQVTTLTLTFDRAPSDDCVRVALFDANTIGRWDQRVDLRLVDKAPDVIYEVFAPTAEVDDETECTEDLLFDTDPSNDPEPIFVTSAYKHYNKLKAAPNPQGLTTEDDVWTSLVDWSTAQAEANGLKLSDGRFRLVFRARLVPAPQGIDFLEDHDPLTVDRDISSFTGRERAAYKIAFNGTYLIPAGGVVGFAGGIIDERVGCDPITGVGCGSTEDDVNATTGTADPVRVVDPTLAFNQKDDGQTYFYDGVFNFHIHSTQACKGDINYTDADADWVDVANLTAADFDANGFLRGSKLTGIPPENVGRYIRPSDLTCDGKRDVGGVNTCADVDRLVGFDTDPAVSAEGVIKWNLFPIPGFPGHNTDPLDPTIVPTFSSDQPAFGGRPSITAAQEASLPPVGVPFKSNPLSAATLQATPGLWCLQWQGVDCANFVFLRFDRPVGTTPRPTLKIDVFCDANDNCERDDLDFPVPLGGGKVALKLTQVDCDTGETIDGGLVMNVTTDENGVWASSDCPAMLPACYRIEFDGTPPLEAGENCPDLPRIVDLRGNGQDSQCVTVELPRDCTGMICGDVYCETTVDDCAFDPSTDDPLPSGAKIRIIATPTGPMGMGTPVETEVTAPETNWCIEGLDFGTYTISYVWVSDEIELWDGCTATRQVEITAQSPSVQDVDFGFNCTVGKICGDVYCESTDDCLYDDNVLDRPLPAGTVVTVILQDATGATVDTVTVTAPATRYCFEELARGDYRVSVSFAPGSVTWELGGSCDDVKDVTIDTQTSEVDDCDFGFKCVGDICGDVYCEFGTDCGFDATTGSDEPLPAGTKYTVTATPIVNGVDVPAGAITIDGTAPVTRYCFEDLPLGQYRITVSEDPTTPATLPLPALAPTCQASRTVTITAQSQLIDDVDFGYICFVNICGDVYCEETENCLLDAGTSDGPLPAGSEVEVTLVQVVGTQVVPGSEKKLTVVAPATRYCFERLPFGTYEISYAFTSGVTLELAADCDSVKTVTANAQTGSIDDCDFGFVCDADLTGRVFCDVNLNGTYETPPDSAPIGATVEAQLIPASGPLPPALTQAVGAEGTFAFNNIPAGTYRVRVISIDPTSWTPLFDNVNGIEVTIPTGESRNVLLPYDCRTCEIHGTVYCDDDLSGTLSLGDLRFAGVEVTATGPSGPLTATTNASGEYAFLDLEPGLWVITVDPDQAPYNTAPPRPTAPLPLEYRLECERGDRVMDKDFRSLCLGRIYGYVFQDPLGDCDGVYQQTDVPVDGARIRLTGPGILPAPNPREAVTNADGFYQFGDLPRGTYKVEILDPLLDKWVVLGLTLNGAATPREVPEVVLPRLGEQRVDFGFCIQKLEGYVFQDDPKQDCDGIYQAGSDIPVDGARIRLTGPASLPGDNPRETTTDANGYYMFPNLVPGDYTVEILSPLPDKWEAIHLTLIEDVTARVQDASLPLGEVERKDFGFGTQAMSGKVFKQPYGYWDGVWNPDRDTPLEGVLVELTGTAGDALGYTDSTRTNADGDYFFDDVPTGSFEIRLSETDAQTIAILSGLIDDGQKVLTPTLKVCDRIPDLDFPKCECEQQLCVNVFREEVPVCDGDYDEGVDTLSEFIKVRFEQLSTGRAATLMTDADGRICLPIVEPGDYKVSIDRNQPELVDCRPSPGTVLERIISFDPAECADQELWFGFCCCTKLGCCEGKLHEVVMETRFWMCDPSYEATARLFMDCGGDDLVDVAEGSLVDGQFSGVPGIDGVIKIESIKHDGPLVTVRVRITATGTRFPTKSFGNAKHLVTVTLNGETNQICEVFRAEVMRPGAIPGCKRWDEELCRWVPVRFPCEPGVSYREIDWDANRCENLCWRFGIVEICCFKDWCRCNCFCPPPECKPCTGKVTALKLRYDGPESIWTVLIQSYDGRLLFEGEVKPGDVIPITARGDDGTMGPEVKLFTNQVCTPIKTDCTAELGIGTKWGPFTVIDGASSEGGPFCDPSVDANGNPIEPECRECCKPEKPCDCIAGVTHLAFRYSGDTPKWAVILQSFDGRLLFEGMVRPGGIIRVRAAGDDGTMGSTIKLLTNEFCGELDVTCAEPIGIGTTSGPFQVIAGASRNGGRFCGSPECPDCPDPEPNPCPNCPDKRPER